MQTKLNKQRILLKAHVSGKTDWENLIKCVAIQGEKSSFTQAIHSLLSWQVLNWNLPSHKYYSSFVF